MHSMCFVFSVNKTVGVFWLNAAETWIDISTEDAKKVMHISSVKCQPLKVVRNGTMF